MKKAIKVIGIIISIIAIIVLAQFAYAKYISIINGKAEAQIAQFKFIVTGQSYSAENGIIFATTRNDRNSKVAQNVLAPGTYGEIPINIDATGTQIFLEYTINISLENKPENLKFYYDKERTLEIGVNQIDHYNSEFSRKGFLSFADNDLSRTEYIYWEWPLETGETEEDINKNDVEDSKWMNTIMTMSIGVKGTQVAEKPMYYVANYGDIVNYTTNNKTIRGVVVNKIADVVEIMPIITSKDIEENPSLSGLEGKAVTVGNVKLGCNGTETDTEKRRSQAIDSYNNAIKILNKEAVDNYNKASRALTVNDVNRLVRYIPTEEYISIVYEQEYTSAATEPKRFIVDELTEVKTINNEIILATQLDGIKLGDTIIIGNTYGEKTVKSITMKCTKDKISTNANYEYNNSEQHLLSKYFTTTPCWLASRCLHLKQNECYYYVRHCNSYHVYTSNMYGSNGNTNFFERPVIPVISLSSSVRTRLTTDENNPDKIIWEVTE